MIRLDPAQYRLLLNALRKHFEKGLPRQGPVGEEIKEVSAALARLQASAVAPQPVRHPLVRHLPVALSLVAAQAADLAHTLGPLAAQLPWRYGYAARKDAPNLENEMGWAEIVGPDAPFKSDEVCFGLTLIGAHCTYPPHRHPARELYLVLAGRAGWTVGDQTYIQPPGAYILHEPDVVHAMRTSNEPLLAIYSWTGDVVSPSVWANDDPSLKG